MLPSASTILSSVAELFRRHVPVVLLILWVALSLFIRVPWAPAHTEDAEPAFHKVLLLSSPAEKPRTLAFEAVMLDTVARLRPEQLLLYLAKDSLSFTYRPGDVLLVRSALSDGRGYVPSGASVCLENRSLDQTGWLQGRLRRSALAFRQRLENALEAQPMRPESVALIESLLLGDRRLLSRDQRYAFADSGAMHVLAVSGLHVGIIQSLLMGLFTLGGFLVIPWHKKRLRRLLTLCVTSLVWGYAFLTGLSLSVLRSALMFTVLPVGNMHKDTPVKYNRLAVAALIILLIDPSAYRSPSFLLSFGAVLALMYYTPRWSRRYRHFHPGSRFRKCLIGLYKKLRNLTSASLAAQIGTLPFTLLFFGQTANYFFLTNILVIPLATFLLAPFGLLCLFLSAVAPFSFLTRLVVPLTDWSAWLMNTSVRFVQHLPGAVGAYTFTPLMAALLASFIIFLTAYLRLRKVPALLCLMLAVLSALSLVILYASSL